jgi:hypothetical protein
MRNVTNAGMLMALGGAGIAIAIASGPSGVLNAPTVPPTVVPPSCTVPHHPGPGYNASITNQQNGQRICIGTGEKLLVILTAPSPSGPPWRQITAAPPGTLRVAPLTLMLARGVTATNFLAVRKGVTEVTSVRPACAPAPPGGAACDAIELWRATVVVQGQFKPS